jgi:hypothetical protein
MVVIRLCIGSFGALHFIFFQTDVCGPFFLWWDDMQFVVHLFVGIDVLSVQSGREERNCSVGVL